MENGIYGTIIVLLIFLVGLIIAEIKTGNDARGKIHKRIDGLDNKYVGIDLCIERGKKLDEIANDVKELLRKG